MICRVLPAILVALGQFAAPVAQAAEPTKQECVSANESAQDLRRAAQLREAKKQLAVCVSASCPAPVREDCAARLSEVDAAMPSLVLIAKDRAGNDVSSVVVTMDGLPFADTLDGAAVQVDPGEHKFIFEGEGLPSTEKVIVVHEGDKSRHVNVVLGGTVAPEAPPPEAKESLFSPNHRRIMGLAAGGAGAAGIVLGAIFGLVAKSTYDKAWTECGQDARGCTPQGVHDGQTAHQQATVSTVSFVAGALLLGGGAALYLTAPKGPTVAVTPGVSLDGAGLRIRAVW
jgi:hypothetical protein